jgi:phosphoglycerate dehydrogenase-like enzyme
LKAAFAGSFSVRLIEPVRRRLTIPYEIVSGDEAGILDQLGGADVLVSMAFTKEMAAAGNGLRLVQVPGAGLDRIDRSQLRAGLALANAYGHEAELMFVGGPERLDDLLSGSDYLAITLSLSAETRGLIDARRLGLMKPSAYLINVARAEIVDEKALYNALASGRLAGAALDVWYHYPTSAGSTAPAAAAIPSIEQCDHDTARLGLDGGHVRGARRRDRREHCAHGARRETSQRHCLC